MFTLASRKGKSVLASAILGSGIVYLAGTTTSIAMPVIQEVFGAPISMVQWVFNAFALAAASLLLLGGTLGDHWGMRRLFIGGLLLFMAGQVMTALAPSVAIIIAAQAVAGIGAAMLLPNSLGVVNACFGEGHRGQALGLWAGLSAGFAALGPFLGGWLVDAFGWTSVFWVHLPFGLATLVLAFAAVPKGLGTAKGSIDRIGTMLIVLSFFGISYGLIQGPADGWTAMPVALGLALGGSAFAGFVAHQIMGKEPMIPRAIFRNRNVVGANVLTLLLYTGLSTLMIFIVFRFQQVIGMSATATGLGMAPPILAISLLSGPAGKLVDRIGPRLQATVGPLLVAASLVWMALPDAETPYMPHFLLALSLFGIGMAIAIPALTMAALDVRASRSAIASGISNAVSRTSTLLAIVLMGAVMVTAFTADLASRLAAADLPETLTQGILDGSDRLAAISVPDGFSEGDLAAAEAAIDGAFVHGFRRLMGLSAGLAILGSVAAFSLIRNPKRDV